MKMLRTPHLAGLVALAAVLLVTGCRVDQPGPTTTTDPGSSCRAPGLPNTVEYSQISGVDPNLLSVDVYAPSGICDAPVVMWVHGGGYQIGDKSQQLSDKVRLFNDNGWILVSVNYRLTVPGDPGSAQFPDHFDDVAAAVAWVDGEIGNYGGDPSRIALLGHSAGADIVSNVVTNPQYLAQHGLGLGDVSCAGPLDTEGFDKVAAGADGTDSENDQWAVALGNNPDYLTETSATMLIEPGIDIPPMIGVIRGGAERRLIETAFLDALEGAGIAATRIDATSLTHAQVSNQIGAPGDTVMTEPVVRFLTDCFSTTPGG